MHKIMISCVVDYFSSFHSISINTGLSSAVDSSTSFDNSAGNLLPLFFESIKLFMARGASVITNPKLHDKHSDLFDTLNVFSVEI